VSDGRGELPGSAADPKEGKHERHPSLVHQPQKGGRTTEPEGARKSCPLEVTEATTVKMAVANCTLAPRPLQEGPEEQQEMAVKADRPRHPDDLEGLLVHPPGDRKAQQGVMLHRRPVHDGLEPRPLPGKGRRKREARSITRGQHIKDPRVLSE